MPRYFLCKTRNTAANILRWDDDVNRGAWVTNKGVIESHSAYTLDQLNHYAGNGSLAACDKKGVTSHRREADRIATQLIKSDLDFATSLREDVKWLEYAISARQWEVAKRRTDKLSLRLAERLNPIKK